MRISDWSSDVCSSDLLVHWATRHGDDHYRFRGREISGGELAEEVRADLTESLTGAADFNRVFTQNGIACTTSSLIAATRGITRLDEITEAEVPATCAAHVLLCASNACPPIGRAPCRERVCQYE